MVKMRKYKINESTQKSIFFDKTGVRKFLTPFYPTVKFGKIHMVLIFSKIHHLKRNSKIKFHRHPQTLCVDIFLVKFYYLGERMKSTRHYRQSPNWSPP